MRTKSRKILIVLCVIVVAGAGLWIGRYPALYYYYLWRLNRTTCGSVIIPINENIESISPHTIPLLVRTYKNVNAPAKSRGAAAGGLIKADKNKAENLFISFLSNQDAEIVAAAIFHLGIAESDKPFKTIIKFAHHRNENIRWAVASYLGHFNNSESISLLKEMMTNDPDNTVRDGAMYRLQLLGVLPMK